MQLGFRKQISDHFDIQYSFGSYFSGRNAKQSLVPLYEMCI